MPNKEETNEKRAFTAADVAKWMQQEIQKEEVLYQADAVDEISERFGEEFVYENNNGNPAISRKVLDEFRKLTEKTVDWSGSEKAWFLRDPDDTSEGREID